MDKSYNAMVYLVSDNLNHFKALFACQRIHDHVAMDSKKMSTIQDSIFVLTGGVDDFSSKFLPTVRDYLGEGILDLRTISANVMAVNELYGQRGFP